MAEHETVTAVADPPEVLTPEIVDASTRGGEVVRRSDAHSAIEAAAEAALSSPGIPGRDEFLSLAMQARMLSLSSGAPKAVRNNPHLAFHMAMIGRDLGISPSAAIELIDVIAKDENDPNARLSLSPQLLNGQIRRLGLGRIEPLEVTLEHAIARAIGPNGEILGDVEFTWEDAQIAGLVDDRCPDARTHWKGSNGQRCSCRQGWRTYPKRMLWWRASGFAGDDHFPEAGLGLYSPEELGSVVDEEGRPIDPATIELPEGFTPAPPPPRPSTTLADLDELWTLQERIAALPQQEKDDLRDRWGQSNIKGRPARALSQQDYKLAAAMVAGFEKMAEKGGEWKAAEALETVRAQEADRLMAAFGLPEIDGGATAPPTDAPAEGPSEAAETPEPSPATDAAPEPGDAPEGTTATDGGEPPSPERIEQVIALVQKLTPGELTGALRARSLPATGNDDSRRRRLCEAILTGAAESLEQRGDTPAAE